MEPIPACQKAGELKRQLRGIDWRDETVRALTLINTIRSLYNDCNEEAHDADDEGGEVYIDTRMVTIEEFEEHIANQLKQLNTLEDAMMPLLFSAAAGGSLDDHESYYDRVLIRDKRHKLIFDRHTITDHVFSSADPFDCVSELQSLLSVKGRKQASKFFNKDVAQRVIGRTIALNNSVIKEWLAQSALPWPENTRLELLGNFDAGPIGLVLDKARQLHVSTMVWVVLVRDSSRPSGFWVKTSYPLI